MITDYNDNTQLVFEPPKLPNKVNLHQSESFDAKQEMEECCISVCNDKVTPLRCGLKRSLSHERKLLQSSQVLEDDVSTQEVPKKPKGESDLLYPTPPDHSIKRRRKTSEGITHSQDC